MSLSYFLWSVCVFAGLVGVSALLKELRVSEKLTSSQRERAALKRVAGAIKDIEEILEGGLLPPQKAWEELRALPDPWGKLTQESLIELRSSGGAILPTLKRLRALATSHQAALAEASSRSAQAIAQAAVCLLLVPVLGAVLHLLLPGLEDRQVSWWIACACSMAIAAAGALWLLSLADSARWAGLKPVHRSWILAAPCAGERFLALLRSGQPPDLAWTRAVEGLRVQAPGLAWHWGGSIFEFAKPDPGRATRPGVEAALISVGEAVRSAVHASLMDGRSCSERVEALFEGLRTEVRAAVDRELTLLGTRALKPLFICVAPSLLGLLGAGMWLGLSAELRAGGLF